MDDNVEQNLQELKEKSAKLKKQVSDTNKGLEKLLKKVNGHDTEADTPGSDDDSGRIPGLGDSGGARPQ